MGKRTYMSPMRVLTKEEEDRLEDLYSDIQVRRNEIRSIVAPHLLNRYYDDSKRLTWAMERRTYRGFRKYLFTWLRYLF